MLVEDMDDIIVQDIYEVKFGKFNVSLAELADLTPARINMSFMAQDEFDSGCGFRINNFESLFLKFDDRVSYEDEFVKMLSSFDGNFIENRNLTFELTRVVLPTYAIKYNDDKIIEIESFASFFRDGYFSITYRYKDLDNVLSYELIDRIKNWSNIQYLCFDELLSKKLKLEVDLDKIESFSYNLPKKDNYIEYDNKKIETFYIGYDYRELNNFNLLDSKIKFMLEFICSYIFTDREIEPNYITYNPSFYFYYLKDKLNTSFSGDYMEVTGKNIRKIIENRPSFYSYNNLVNEPLNDISVSKIQKILFSNKYLISIIPDLKKEKYSKEKFDFILENNMKAFAQSFVTIEFFLIERFKIIKGINELKHINFEGVNKYELYRIKADLMDLQLETNTYDFLFIDGNKISDIVKNTLKINSLYDELNFLYKKIENTIEEESTKQQDKSNLLIQILSLLISIPSTSVVIDYLFAILSINDISPRILSLIKLSIIVVISYFILRFTLSKHEMSEFTLKYNIINIKPKLTILQWLALVMLFLSFLLFLILYFFAF